ncbi:DUF3103 family protein [Streptomyces roseicoloratus]|uniref:DUF3103 family protein n=1 Tax=Streptomyces roseicoloratus TaxID=2508722 RepID=A0ABY9RYA0_9ACTN|nr:DUF3103 family protein [Streptomyces roseicoloratus]WMX47170.1 DUF3103 family protein [Streptomyces roseicoloratus]
MRPRPARRRGTLTATAAALAALCAAQTLGATSAASATSATSATPAPAPGRAVSATEAAVGSAQDRAARDIARSLGDSSWRTSLRTATLKAPGAAGLPVTERATGALKDRLAAADQDIAEAKGLAAGTGSLLRLRLGDPSMRTALAAGVTPWVAAAVSDDDTDGTVTAYDSEGRAHRLDARTAPGHPVYVVDIDSTKALAAGLDVLRKELAKAGIASADRRAVNTLGTTAGFWTTKITSVRLNDDEEPWVKGDAEVYTLVSGFGHDGKVRVDPVDMPYLDNDGTTYRPNQILVNWSNYKYNLADAVMMEEDGSTNYRDLAKAIATVLLTITDQGAYVPLVNAILDAIPDDRWTDDPDYVDSWYTLAQQSTGTRYGARGNGTLTVEPYYVQQF